MQINKILWIKTLIDQFDNLFFTYGKWEPELLHTTENNENK